jgi:single-stranded-DNA-specific exonuclease
MFTDVSLTGKRWLLPEESGQGIESVIRNLAESRQLSVPAVMPTFPDMQRTTDRIFTAISRGEQIAIFGDYDCDGITATALLVRFFQRKGVHPIIRLPHRIHDGYGLSSDIIDEFVQAEVTLLITVDNGISALTEIAHAAKNNIDVIVTDHHAVGTETPNAYAILHPEIAQAPKPYPSGAGVAYMLVHALEEGEWQQQPEDCVLAMCGTVADLVELRGYNRLLVSQGLAALENIASGPLALLRDSTEARTSTDIAFRVAPRINAAGRMGDPSLALEALLTGGNALSELDELNSKRQLQMREIYEQAAMKVDLSSPLLFAADKSYPHGMIGLVAGKLTETSGRPSCVVVIQGEECTASLRSTPNYSVVEGLGRCKDLLTRFGGHAQAAGCNFPLAALEKVYSRLAKDIEERTSSEDLQPFLEIDAILSPEHISLTLCEALSTLEPFGSGNREPRFLLSGVKLQDARTVGADGTHMQCLVAGKKAIGFGLGSLIEQSGKTMDIVCRVQQNHWNGYTQPQVVIEDMRIAKKESAPAAVEAKTSV